MEVSGQPDAPSALSPRIDPAVSIEQEVRGLQSRSGRFGKEKTPLSLLGFEPRIIQPVA
jgi:hypothetical protein